MFSLTNANGREIFPPRCLMLGDPSYGRRQNSVSKLTTMGIGDAIQPTASVSTVSSHNNHQF